MLPEPGCDYPSKAFIRFHAEHQLQADLTRCEVFASIKRSDGRSGFFTFKPNRLVWTDMDEAIDLDLLDKAISAALDSEKNPQLFKFHPVAETRRLEEEVSARIVQAYIKLRVQERDRLARALMNLLQ